MEAALGNLAAAKQKASGPDPWSLDVGHHETGRSFPAPNEEDQCSEPMTTAIAQQTPDYSVHGNRVGQEVRHSPLCPPTPTTSRMIPSCNARRSEENVPQQAFGGGLPLDEIQNDGEECVLEPHNVRACRLTIIPLLKRSCPDFLSFGRLTGNITVRRIYDQQERP